MEEEKLCDPCSRLLRGERDATVPLSKDALHHADAQSFRQALQIPCYICTFVWKKPFEPFPGDGELPDGVQSQFYGNDAIANELSLSMHPEGVYPLKFIPLRGKSQAILNEFVLSHLFMIMQIWKCSTFPTCSLRTQVLHPR